MVHASLGLRRTAVALAAATALLLGVGGGQAAEAAPAVSCADLQVPVALNAGGPDNQQINGEFCATAAELRDGRTVQLLVHGATYNHSYWDFGSIDGTTYSYARDVAAAGYPTFAIDEIGAGASSHPLSALVTITAAAYVEHEILQDLEQGRIAGVRFGRVILVGHSLGSLTTELEGATYNDAAGIILTGAAHDVELFDATGFLQHMYPAPLDPAFSDRGLDVGYETTAPGSRGTLFYNSSDTDPAVIARDEATKDALSTVYADTGIAAGALPTTLGIHAPVLMIMGQDDNFFCGTEIDGATFNCDSGQDLVTQEGGYYTPAAELRGCVVPGSGHDINLELNHDVEETDAVAWSDAYIGQAGAAAGGGSLPAGCSG